MSTWREPNCDLFAYNTWNLAEARLRLTGGMSIHLSEAGCFIAKDGETENEVDISCTVLRRRGTTHTDHFALRCSEEMWFPLRLFPPSNSLVLCVGMEIRFGRIRYIIEELDVNTTRPPERPEDPNCSASFDSVCRICLSGTATDGNPLLSVCKCAGSMRLIHFECAKALVLCKIRTSDNAAVDSYHLQPVYCDLCSAEIPLKHTEKNVEFQLRNIFKPFGAYMKVIKATDPTEFHFIHPGPGKVARIGRGRNNDWSIADTSVSRNHATLEFTEEGFVLRDLHSKFGTLVRAGNEVVLPFGEQQVIQVRKSLLYLTAKKPWQLPRCCCRCCKRRKKESACASIALSKDLKEVSEPSTRKHEDTPLETGF